MLCESLSRIRQQVGYERYEVLVGNDGGRERLEQELGRKYPEIKFIDYNMNRGPAAVRNELFERARGEYVFSLDDDAWYLQEDAIQRAIQFLEGHPEAGVLVFSLQLSGGLRVGRSPSEKQLFETVDVLEGANAIRRKLFLGEPLYDADDFFIGEGKTLAMKCLKKGFQIVHTGNISVWHERSVAERNNGFRYRCMIANQFSFYLKFFPLRQALICVLRSLRIDGANAFEMGLFDLFCRAVFDFIVRIPALLRRRSPVSDEVFEKYETLAVSGRLDRPYDVIRDAWNERCGSKKTAYVSQPKRVGSEPRIR